MKKNKSVCIANIGKPRGLKGEFFLNSFCSPKENILNYIDDIFIDNENKLSIEYIKKSNSKFLAKLKNIDSCLLYTSPSPRDVEESRMPSSA